MYISLVPLKVCLIADQTGINVVTAGKGTAEGDNLRIYCIHNNVLVYIDTYIVVTIRKYLL